MNDDSAPETSTTRRVTRIVLGGVIVVVVLFVGIFVYAKVINDAPDELDESDLADALVADTADTTTAPSTTPTFEPPTGTDQTTNTNASADTASSTATSFDGDWVPTTASEFGYRVDEVLAGIRTPAVGRGNEISGLLTIEGTTATALAVEVQIDGIKSDDALRDGQFRGRIMNADEFPTATFTLTEPIEFGSFPSGDERITATATGDLTLRGTTNTVTFEVTAQSSDARIGVLGSIPVLFADYGIDNPSFGAVRTEDEGLVEFVLVFESA